MLYTKRRTMKKVCYAFSNAVTYGDSGTARQMEIYFTHFMLGYQKNKEKKRK